MCSPTITIPELLFLGFTQSDKQFLDKGDYYKTYVFRKNDSELCFTFKFTEIGDVTNVIVDFNCETLKGIRLNMPLVKILKDIM